MLLDGAELLLEQSPPCCVRQPRLLPCVCRGRSGAHRGKSRALSRVVPDNKADRDRHGAVCGSHRPALLWSTRPFQLGDVMKAHCSVCVKLKVANGRPGVGGRGGRAGQAGECDKLGEMRVCLRMKEGGRIKRVLWMLSDVLTLQQGVTMSDALGPVEAVPPPESGSMQNNSLCPNLGISLATKAALKCCWIPG